MKRLLSIAFAAIVGSSAMAQQLVPVGKGSYASYAPLSKSKTDQHEGDQSMYMQKRPLYITERPGQPIPTNDWWTDMIKETQRYSGHLWSYPQYIEAVSDGVTVAYPDYWIMNGTEMKPSATPLHLFAKEFNPECAVADKWHDWDLSILMEDGRKQMYITTAHGMPFTWVEMSGLTPAIEIANDAELRDGNNNAFVSGSNPNGKLVYIATGRDYEGNTIYAKYGIYFPETVTPVIEDGVLTLQGNCPYVVVALLNDVTDLNTYSQYALNVPRDTKVEWNYAATEGKVKTTWKVETENLKTHAKGGPVLQGFIPHHYRDTAHPQFSFLDGDDSHITDVMDMFERGRHASYPTPHGRLRLAEGTSFEIDYEFSGMLPYYAVPSSDGSGMFNEDMMREMIAQYANLGSFGTDTYWGGKGLTQMALYMTFARELGYKDLFDQCRTRLKAALIDWLTWTPGEDNTFFARNDRWGALIGYNTSYDSETFNDHHFHYGYFTYAGALLALVDDDFRQNYGGMLREVAKDYANWDRNDTRYPLFRTFDPWAGHSFAGGMGDGNGNGQESSSEAMQSWGGLYLLGVALGDDAMRDAGIFGWVSEARATAEYWFDRHRDNIIYKEAEYYDDDNVPGFRGPYNSNITCHGVGWWNYFSGDQLWNAAIQWMPISPCLDYLSEDLDFAAWDYHENWSRKSIAGWLDEDGPDGTLGNGSGLGNVVLSYLQRSDPQDAADLFQTMWDNNKSTVKAADTGGISYFVIHNHLTYGDIDWQTHGSIPTSRVFEKNGVRYYMAYNSTSQEITVSFSDGHAMTAAPRQLTVDGQESIAINDITPVDDSEPDPRESIIMQNLALGKPCTASSYENVGTLVEYATDGKSDTRWGSSHQDNEWIYVDLGEDATIYKIGIDWEAAFASEYKIELSNDNIQWTELGTYTTSGGKDVIEGKDAHARYIRLTGLKRATQYGISLYELKVFGNFGNASAKDLMGMTLTTDVSVLKQGESTQITAKGYTIGGEWVDVQAEWSTQGGTITQDGVFTPSEYGMVGVTAKVGSLEVTKQLPVEESFRPKSISLEASLSRILIGDKLQLRTNVADQFNTSIANAPVEYIVERDGVATDAATVTESGVFSGTEVGEYHIYARYAGLEATLVINIVDFGNVNLALHKPVKASSQKDNPQSLITDGSYNTRWESVWGVDPQHVTIDLEGSFNINKVFISWEGAAASKYSVLVSTDGNEWTELGSYNLSDLLPDLIPATLSKGVTHEYSDTPARYVRILGTKRLLEAYGYSIYEVEVYGTSRIEEDDIATGIKPVRSIEYPVSVYSPTGMFVKTLNSPSDALPRGMYILRSANGTVVKAN